MPRNSKAKQDGNARQPQNDDIDKLQRKLEEIMETVAKFRANSENIEAHFATL